MVNTRILVNLAGGMLLCAAAGVADNPPTTTMMLTGVAGPVMGGVYTSPYVATIGSAVGVNVICDDFADDSYVNESWTAYVTPLSSLNTSSPVKWKGNAYGTAAGYSLTQPQAYATEAVLAEELLSQTQATQAGQITAGEYSYAMWGLFDPAAFTYLSSQSSADTGYAQAAINDLKAAAAQVLTNNLTPASFPNVTLYSYDTGAAGCGGPCTTPPQEFIAVKMAEPPIWGSLSAYLIVGAGALFAFRRRVAQSPR